METITPSNRTTPKPSAKEIKALVASYLAEQPASLRKFHRLMSVLEGISLALIAIVFITALVLSFLWKTIPTQAIPAAWFLLPVSGAILLLLTCVHAIGLKVFPPSSLYIYMQSGSSLPISKKTQEFRTGTPAVLLAWGLLALGLVIGGFFAIFSWAAWTVNWSLLTPLMTILGYFLGISIAVGIVGGMIAKTYKKLSKTS